MNLSLLIELTKKDFTEKYSGSVLGVLWSFILPLVNISIYTIIFGKLMGARLPGVSSEYSYVTYLVAGLVPWTLFVDTVSRTSTLFVDKKNIITKIRVSLPSLPLYIVMSESITFIITLSFYIIFLIITGTQLNKALILLPFIFITQQIFAFALGFFVAIFHVFIRDLKEVIGIVLQIWFWFTPIIYVVDIVPDFVKGYFSYNPAYMFVKAYQDIFIFGQVTNFNYLIRLTILSHLLLLISYLIFKRLEKDVRDNI